MLSDFVQQQRENAKLPKIERPEVKARKSKLGSGSGNSLGSVLNGQIQASRAINGVAPVMPIKDNKDKIKGSLYSSSKSTRMQSAAQSIKNLIVNRIYADKDLTVTVYDGKANELVENFEKYHDLERTRDVKIQEMKSMIETKRNDIPLILNNMKQEEEERLSKAVYDAKNAIEGMRDNIQDRINSKRESLRETINDILTSYDTDYNSIMDELKTAHEEVQKTITELRIPRRAVQVPKLAEDPDTEDLLALVESDKELILQLKNVNVDLNLLQRLTKEHDNKVKSSVIAATSTIFTPISISYALFGLGKKVMDIGINKKLIIQLQDEILTCSRIIKDQLDEFSELYCKPDVSDYEEQLASVENEVNCEYADALNEAEKQYKMACSMQQDGKDLLYDELDRKKASLEEEIEQLEKDCSDQLNNYNETIKQYADDWRRQRQEFIDSQIPTDYTNDVVTAMASELTPGNFLKPKRVTTIDKLRYYATYETLCSLEIKDAPADDSDEEKAMYEYDQKVLIEKEELRKKIEAVEAEGWTRETLKQRVTKYERDLDKYYVPLYRGLDAGLHIMPDNVKAAVDGAEEFYRLDIDNKTIVFLFDDEHEGEEEVLANYIKFMVQQMLLHYHPSSIKVNIINPTMSRLFGNLQVDMTKINKESGEVEKGRPYSNIYNEEKEINDCFEEINKNIDILMKTDLAYQDCDQLTMSRRQAGAVTPVYQINVLHRVDISKTPFARYNEEAGALGMLNIYLINKNSFLKLKNTGDGIVEEPENLEILKNVNILGEMQIENDQNIIYMTNLKKKEISRFIYTCRTQKEENEMSIRIGDRAKGMPTSPVLTEEFVDNITNGTYWQGNAKKNVKLYFGYINGDHSKAIPTVLDENAKVHMFIGGTTGGGKSNVLAVMVNCLKMMYPPSQLDIIYFDFKVVEVAIHANPYKMPHCTAMSGTGQSSYLISLLDYCMTEMMSRYNLFKQYNVLKLSEVIDAMTEEIEQLRAQGKDKEADELYLKMPRRLVMIVDEAAQAFQSEDNAVVDKVKDTIIKLAQLARAAGIHMILVSQDPAKMPAAVVNLLAVRGCTKATPDVSKSIMNGNDICGRSENQFIGFFATNDDPKGAEAANKKYVVPLNMPEVTKRFSKIAYDMAKNDINRDPVIFDDDTLYTEKRHNLFLEKHPNIKEGHNVLLGEQAIFLREFKPKEFVFTKGDQQNLGVFSTNVDVRANIFRTIVESTYENSIYWPVYCKSIPDYAPLEFFVNKAKKQGYYDNGGFMFYVGKNICDYDEYDEIYEERFEQFFAGDVRTKDESRFADTWKEGFMTIFPRFLQHRKKVGETKPMYVFIFDVEKHAALVQASITWKDFGGLSADANTLDVHFICISSDGASMLTRNFLGHAIASRIGDELSYPKQFKKIPDSYCKYVNMLDKAEDVLYKPIQFESSFKG